MHIHKFEKYWLNCRYWRTNCILSYSWLWCFLSRHPSAKSRDLIDPENIEANEAFKKENLGFHEIGEGKYVLNVVASAFNYDLGADEDGKPVKNIQIPKDSKVLDSSNDS